VSLWDVWNVRRIGHLSFPRGSAAVAEHLIRRRLLSTFCRKVAERLRMRKAATRQRRAAVPRRRASEPSQPQSDRQTASARGCGRSAPVIPIAVQPGVVAVRFVCGQQHRRTVCADPPLVSLHAGVREGETPEFTAYREVDFFVL
jgi:hypothetical protein